MRYPVLAILDLGSTPHDDRRHAFIHAMRAAGWEKIPGLVAAWERVIAAPDEMLAAQNSIVLIRACRAVAQAAPHMITGYVAVSATTILAL